MWCRRLLLYPVVSADARLKSRQPKPPCSRKYVVSIINLDILYIIIFEPATIHDLVTGLSFLLDVFVFAQVTLRSGVILFQMREEIFAFVKG